MKKTTLALVLLAVTAASAVEAQETPPDVAAGDKVRLTRAGWGQQRFTATVVEVQRDVLLIRTEPKGPPRSVSLAGLAKLEVARGKRNYSAAGALIGAVPGFLLGLWAGGMSCFDAERPCSGTETGIAAP